MHDNRNLITLQQPFYHFSESSNLSIDLILEKKNQCHLIQLDPWDPQLIPYLYPDWNPWKTCNISRRMHTELQNSIIRMHNETTSKCKYRCLYTNGEMDFRTDKWIEMKKMRDIMKVIKPKGKVFQKEDNLHPGVFILVFDSTSSSSGIRTMMETNQAVNSEVLRQLYDATTFYYHNKVGLNSRPNAFAMFSGTRISELDENLFLVKVPRNIQILGGVKRNETVTYDFTDQNYASLIVEDWIGAFNWPNCKGYGDPPTDHYGGALVLRSTGDKTTTDENDFDIHFYKGECQERYHKLMNFASKFLNEYNGISKFVMIWLSMLTHDSASGLYRTDKFTVFCEFFRENAKNLDNSFIFVMGDHGLRFGKIRATPSGQIEDNNPLLMVAIPKYLRSNEQLILNLKRNSRKHTSQFDFYATLYDIARYARKDNFQKWDKHDFRKEFGEIRGGIRARSILRPISYDRTCEEMEIPKEYCICEQIWHKSDVHNDDATKAAQLIIANINDFLKQKILHTVCERLNFTEVISAEYLEGQQIFKIVVSASPSHGKYEAQLLKKNDNFKIITKIIRLDQYGNQGYCAPDEDVRPLCYCRKQLTMIMVKH
ncbi:hypothetical protein DINM_022369 [Dirofilaria immitis]|nr:hypothetical protein [Dirofilaria immitis]